MGYWENLYGHWVEQSWKNGNRKSSSLESFRADNESSCQEGQTQPWSSLRIWSPIPSCISMTPINYLCFKTILSVWWRYLTFICFCWLCGYLTHHYYNLKNKSQKYSKWILPAVSINFNKINLLSSFNSKEKQVSLKLNLIWGRKCGVFVWFFLSFISFHF